MDKFNRVLKVLQKYQFWVVCGAVVLVAIICWWWASRGLAGQFQQRKAKLEEKFKGVVIPPGHPNEEVITNIGKQRKSLQDNVLKAWETLYKEQKEKNPFPQELGENFKEEFEKLKPKEELRDKYREDYQNFILRHFPSLLKLVDVRRSADEQEPVVPGEARPGGPRAAPMRMDGRTGIEGPAGRDRRTARNFEMAPGGPGGRMPGVAVRREGTAEDDKIGIVDWNASDITALESRFNWKDTPSTLAVVLAQEDLWVIEALLRVIANTNEGTTYATAAVKQIHTLQIGKDAVGGRQGEEGMFRAGPAGGMPPADRAWKGPPVQAQARGAKTKDSSRTATSMRRASRCNPSRTRRVQDDAHPHEPRDGPATAAQAAGRVRQLEHAHRGEASPHPQDRGQHA